MSKVKERPAFAVAILLAIAIVAGALLAVCNSFLRVTDQERTDRILASIYGSPVSSETIDLSDKKTNYTDGTVNQAYKITDDGNYLINVTGFGGYKGGIGLWVVAEFEGETFTGIGKVQIADIGGETKMSEFGSSFFEEYSKHDAEILEGAIFATDVDEGLITHVVSGTTKSSNAMNNAVNTAVEFVNTVILGNGGSEPEIPQTEGLVFASNIKSVTATVNRNKVEYKLEVKSIGNVHDNFVIAVTVDKTMTVTSFEILVNGSSTKDDGSSYADSMYPGIEELLIGKSYAEIQGLLGTEETKITGADHTASDLHTGATESNTMCLVAAAYATGNYSWYVSNGAYASNMKSVTATVNRNKVEYELEVKSIGNVHDNFVIAVTVDKTMTVASFEILVNGSSTKDDGSSYADSMYPGIEELLIGKSYAQIQELLGTEETKITGADHTASDLHTGATESNTMCLIAAAFATGNYAVFIG